MATERKKLYGLIGFPLGHSFSQMFFNQKFEAENINAEYHNFELPDIGDLMELISEYPLLEGLNVTRPYKELVIPYMDDMDETASGVGAVNVIKFYRKGGDLRLKGYNSDVIGFSNSLKPLLTPARRKALILGTGGAAKAVAYSLDKLGIEYQFVSRTSRDGILTYKELDAGIINEHKIIINTTPLGMYPHVDECPDLPYSFLTTEHLCYDLLYNPDVTLFMQRSAEYGAETKNGLEMLMLQAFESWDIWAK